MLDKSVDMIDFEVLKKKLVKIHWHLQTSYRIIMKWARCGFGVFLRKKVLLLVILRTNLNRYLQIENPRINY